MKKTTKEKYQDLYLKKLKNAKNKKFKFEKKTYPTPIDAIKNLAPSLLKEHKSQVR
ncbi:hypothetical protein U8V72_17670 [Priestia filamentosa]|uniref:hypothetical protein n=1 Tax=Priestia filamentosa TaxID=1402861 RepID=UPI000A52A6F8